MAPQVRMLSLISFSSQIRISACSSTTVERELCFLKLFLSSSHLSSIQPILVGKFKQKNPDHKGRLSCLKH
jgi:hypothetical protein